MLYAGSRLIFNTLIRRSSARSVGLHVQRSIVAAMAGRGGYTGQPVLQRGRRQQTDSGESSKKELKESKRAMPESAFDGTWVHQLALSSRIQQVVAGVLGECIAAKWAARTTMEYANDPLLVVMHHSTRQSSSWTTTHDLSQDARPSCTLVSSNQTAFTAEPSL